MKTETIKPFLNEDFLLETKTAEILYHDYAKDLPIIDYHNHLPPAEIAKNRKFENISQAWLAGDHYKWRAMRALGIDEEYITGRASDEEKFTKWAEAVPYTLRNPLFHWTHMELKTYFEIDELLSTKNADKIYQECNQKLQLEPFHAVGLLRKMNVEVICTTDDPTDSLEQHSHYEGSDPKMLPTFRPDKAIDLNQPNFTSYINRLGERSGLRIDSFESLKAALSERMNFFAEKGCKLSDHGLNKVYGRKFTEKNVDRIFQERLRGEMVNDTDRQEYISAIMHFLGTEYANRGWTMQLHLGALRNNNSRLLTKLGPDTGFDSIGDQLLADDLSQFLNGLDKMDRLPKTILYNLNPRDNEMFATMAGNFNDGKQKGKVQYGSAWWFLDQKDGMEKQINALSNMGMLSCFIGMLTDSRSFLSFPRHEYFRRILCNLIGKDVHSGELPNDTGWLGEIVMDICYRNAKEYFNF